MCYRIFILALLLASSLSFAQESCSYVSKSDNNSLGFFANCGVVDKRGVLQLNKKHIKNLAFDKDNLACVIYANGSAMYIHKNGKTRRIVYFDNGCDYFNAGRARAIDGDKMVFIDKSLEIVLRPGFDWAEPFDYDHAVVCNGPFVEKNDGEHISKSGGNCGLIDSKGMLVVEAKTPLENSEAFDSYIHSHNQCPAPPITSKESAICHAKRHLGNMKTYGEKWDIFSAVNTEASWILHFSVEDNSEESRFAIKLNGLDAGFISVTRLEQALPLHLN